MSSMVSFLSYIYNTILQAHPRVYQLRADDDAAFPYVTFSFPTGSDFDMNRQDFVLEVDIWDSSNSGVVAENLASAVDILLHKTVKHAPGEFDTHMYRLSRFQLPDPDPKIQRRQLRYECKTYLK
jgi:hypothetical protein